MRWLKHIVPTLLVLAAIAIGLGTLFGDHDSDYGAVTLPAGGTVDLPKGTVEVFYTESGGSEATQLTSPLRFAVTPAGGGEPLEEKPTAKEGTGELEVQRSEDPRSLGSVAKVDAPASGDYVVTGDAGRPAGVAKLTFGTDGLTAVARRWHLLAGLVGAAILIALLPVGRRRHRRPEPETGWSADSSHPYAP